MAALRRKGRKKCSERNIFRFFGGCFEISNIVSADQGDGKLVKDGSEGETVPVNDQAIISSSREIHVVQEVMDDKIDDMSPNKNGEMSPIKPVKLSHSVSIPVLRYKKEKTTPVDEKGKKAKKGQKGKRGKRDKELITNGGFDSIVGALIVLVALIVMLIWGKVCAILCTAAWLYFVPRLRANFDEDYALNLRNGEKTRDLDSKEYKKKVVLQGLLDRNQHYL